MNETFMKEKPVLPLMLSMALPMVLSMMVNSLYNIIDSFFVSQISEEAMTALSLVYPVQNVINAVGIGFGIGINAVIAFYLGAGDNREADRAATQGLVLAVIHGVVMTVCCIAMMPAFLGMFTSSETVIELGVRYCVVAFAFTLVIIVGVTFEKIFQAVGNMKTTMISLMCGCITNIVFDPILIFGYGPFPAMGIEAIFNRHSCHLESCTSVSFDFGAQCDFSSIFRSVYFGFGNLLQITDFHLSAGEWRCTGNAPPDQL